MDERLFARLAAGLPSEAQVLASVRDTRGATPRKRGSRMLVGATWTGFSIGGGAAEARVIEAARGMLSVGARANELQVDLSGRPGAAGVCGGHMRIALRRWHGDADAHRARAIATALVAGRRVVLDPQDIGDPHAADEVARPDPRLLIVGAGHCGLALYDLACFLDFDLWVFDERAACFADDAFPAATRRSGDFAMLRQAFDDEREVYAVLLNRDYPSDVATLRVLADHRLAFLGMMGSRKRIGEVMAALPARTPPPLAPVGLDIGAHTPHEIAVSILAQLVQERARHAG